MARRKIVAYVDSSAAAKLLFEEEQSDALKEFLQLGLGENPAVMSSFLLETELRRAAIRLGAPQELVAEVVALFDLVELDQSVFRQAGLLPGDNLRSLDALHLASAILAGADVVVTYDRRQAEACRTIGLRTISPGD